MISCPPFDFGILTLLSRPTLKSVLRAVCVQTLKAVAELAKGRAIRDWTGQRGTIHHQLVRVVPQTLAREAQLVLRTSFRIQIKINP
jgi:hypothetical protein